MYQFEEPIRILSDLHLAHPGCRIADVSQLAPLFDGVKTLIFNGDTTEERMQKYREMAKVHMEGLKAMARAKGVKLVTVRGNHDPYTPEHGSLDLCDGQVFLTHGDILYPSVSPWGKNAECAEEAREKIEKEYPANFRESLDLTLEVSRRITQEMRVHQPKAKRGVLGRVKTLLSQAWPPDRPFIILKVWKNAPRLAEERLGGYRPNAKVFIVGHTHRPFFVKRNGRVLINTGAFMPMAKSWAIDIERGMMLVRQIRKEAGTFVLGREIGRVDLAVEPA